MKHPVNVLFMLCVSMMFTTHAFADSTYTFEDVPGPFWPEGREIELRVVDADGTAVADADVQVGSENKSAYLKSGRALHPDRVPNTDSEGLFQLQYLEKFTTVVVSHDSGVAIIDPLMLIEQQGPMEVRLLPWSTVSGKLVDEAGQPLAGVDVKLTIGHWTANTLNPMLDVYYTVTTDKTGGFRFDHVPPGEVRVAQYALGDHEPGGPAYPIRGRSAVGRVEPGQELKLKVGGDGRTVRGKVHDAEPSDGPSAYYAGMLVISPRLAPGEDYKKIPLPKPLDFPVWPIENRRAWRSAWDRSLQRLVYEKNWAELGYSQKSQNITAVIERTGRFEVSDVPDGEHVLQLILNDGAVAYYPLDLTKENRGSSATEPEPFDFGLLSVRSRYLGVGEVLPDFEVTEIPVSDPPVVRRLSEFNGKYVLLDFWATWCGPCLKQSPILQEVIKAYEDDDRLVVMCISIDHKADEPAHYVKAKSAGGVQAWLSATQNQARSDAFEIPYVPSIWLIGPDGKIIAQGLFDEAIMQTVNEALAKDKGQ